MAALLQRQKPLGIVEAADYTESSMVLEPDDLVVVYSDGVTEATDSQDRMFGNTGLKSVITECIDESSNNIIGQIDSRLHKFVKSSDLQDDATMVAIKVK